MIENQEPLLRAIIDAFLFLENSSDDEVDPDLAVRTMENMASSLLKLTDADQLRLRQAFSEIATRESEPWRTFVSGLADAIDLKR